jgi:hypothetical protein
MAKPVSPRYVVLDEATGLMFSLDHHGVLFTAATAWAFADTRNARRFDGAARCVVHELVDVARPAVVIHAERAADQMNHLK